MSTHKSQTVNLLATADRVEPIATLTGKKILFVTRTFEYGGAEKHLLDLLSRLRQPGWLISIACFGEDPYSSRLKPDSCIAVDSSLPLPKSLKAWTSFFRRANPDIVVFIYGWSWCFHWFAPIGARLAEIPYRYAIQHLVLPANKDLAPFSRWLRKISGHLNLRLSASALSKTICVSDAVKNSLVREFGFPKEKMYTIHNGVSLLEFAPSREEGLRLRNDFGIAHDDFLLICAARLSEQKGLDILLQAIAHVRSMGQPCKCILIGDGPLRDSLTALSRELGLDGAVFFEGFRADVRPYLRAGSAFILTSHQEGLPLAILEAGACGLPCIVTDVGGNAEAIADHVNGIVVAPGSVDAVAGAISFLLTHPQELRQMASLARVKIQQGFDIEKCMAEIKRVLLGSVAAVVF